MSADQIILLVITFSSGMFFGMVVEVRIRDYILEKHIEKKNKRGES